jgi:hypothetical protein
MENLAFHGSPREWREYRIAILLCQRKTIRWELVG